MTLPLLPDEILVKIASTMAKDGYVFLGPLMMAGKQGRDIVYQNPEVLEGACIYNLCINGADISIGGKYRSFFVRCLQNCNPIATYQEGVRVLAREGDMEKGLALLDKIVLNRGDAALAGAIFTLCGEQKDLASHYLDILTKFHRVDLKSEEILDLGRQLIIDIRGFRPVRRSRFIREITFPIYHSYSIPACFGTTDHYFTSYSYDNNCTECHFWSLATRVAWLI